MYKRQVDICGITEKEIHDNLEEELHQLAEKQKMSYEPVSYTHLGEDGENVGMVIMNEAMAGQIKKLMEEEKEKQNAEQR